MAEFVAQNRAALTELRRALDLPSAVPVRMDLNWTEERMTNLANLKAAALGMDGEVLFLHRHGDMTSALSESLDAVRFGQAISKNGLQIDVLVGIACEAIGMRRLTNLLSNLSAAECRLAARTLEEHESRREPRDAIQRREVEWCRRTYGLWANLLVMIKARSISPKKAWLSIVPGTSRYQRRVRETRLLMLMIASRSFEMEHGRKPKTVDELVPVVLSAAPIDPESQAQLELPEP